MNKKIIIIAAVVVVIVIAVMLLDDTSGSGYAFQNSVRPFKGDPNSSIVLVEFSDFQCPACATAFQEIKKIEEKYGSDIKIEYKHFPLPGHTYAYQAAEASECANDQGSFWPYSELLFTNQSSLTKSDLGVYAQNLNLDMEQFNACLDSKVNRQIINKDRSEGNKLNLKGTPSFFLNNQEVENWLNLDKIIEDEIQKNS